MDYPYLINLEEFKKLIKAQRKPINAVTFECPMCGKHQSADDLINAGVGNNLDEVEKYLAFSCVGRFTGKGTPPKTDEKSKNHEGCNWTLGGFFNFHKLEVETPDGKIHPRFAPTNFQQWLKAKGTR